MSTQPQAEPQPLTIPQARAQLSPLDFRIVLRRTLIDHPEVTLRVVAEQLGVTRQRVALMVGMLNRPTCAHPNKPAPKKEKARASLAELARRVAEGETAKDAAYALGISLNQAMQLGFRAKTARPPHGSPARAASGCLCWRCRRVSGVTLPRGRRPSAQSRIIHYAAILDWLAWCDPDTGEPLTQATIGRLVGVSQPVVSKVARSLAKNS